ncbi:MULTISPECIES: 50S ribosomal protein L4 [Atopobiaceae]|uniref:Large ribosomal subunit protein uL4 n=1 Tax=Parafannyhessea umbonata TaxID=604330 RepID=A0A1H9PN28_9ACTN|nr:MULTISPECIES: 50S ribosomal protein L4 [Atopobiaceae]SEH51958.1 large subunit ribosomal protein L4 [Parafannyhessea umbonata]SER49578.1 large subunit ribosomal protein L4 [Parafannyhessea umbonata]SJZ73554.1 LSU ribosomal protein L4P [Olsenella sp. KH1P3]
MSKIDLKNVEGKAAGTVELSSDVFGIEPNIPVVHQVVVAYEACMRQGTHSTKNRSAVSGGGVKPFRQKGTGRARQGTIRAPQWAGGGVVFGPNPHSHAKRSNNKEKKLAMRSVLSGKLADSQLFLLDELKLEEGKTKQAKAVLVALGVADKRVTVVVADDDVQTYLAFRNLPKVNVIGVSEANTRNLIDNSALVMSAAVAKQLEEVLA